MDVSIRIKPNDVDDGFSINTNLEKPELADGSNQKTLGILKSEEITDRGGTLKRSDSQLAKNIGVLPMNRGRDEFAPHHIISISCAKNSLLMKAAAESGYNINRGTNGIWLPNNDDTAQIVNLPTHTGRHIKKYFTTVNSVVAQKEANAKAAKASKTPWSEKSLLNNVKSTENILRGRIKDLKDPLKLQHADPLKPVDPHPKNKTF